MTNGIENHAATVIRAANALLEARRAVAGLEEEERTSLSGLMIG